MSRRHPIIGVTGSSGAGTSTARLTLARICEEEGLFPAFVEGDAFHAYDREGNRAAIERAQIRGEHFSMFGPGANLLERLDQLLRQYGENGSGVTRHYLHTEEEAVAWRQSAGTFTPWEWLPANTDLMVYEGLHGGYVTEDLDIARHMDLLIGVVPTINLEWIQKLRRDIDERGHPQEEVTQTILRRMPDYVKLITPQFSRTDVNFQRVPLVDTSNPFAVTRIPAQEESLIVVHFNEDTRLDAKLDSYVGRIPGAFLSNPHTMVVPGVQSGRAMDLILRPAMLRLVERQRELPDRDR